MHAHPTNDWLALEKIYFSDKDLTWTQARANKLNAKVVLGVATPNGAITVFSSSPNNRNSPNHVTFNNEQHGTMIDFIYNRGVHSILRERTK